jgi:hypothetical protein
MYANLKVRVAPGLSGSFEFDAFAVRGRGQIVISG